MPIGKYIYCTPLKARGPWELLLSQMPIGKYIYCTGKFTNERHLWMCHKCLSASTFTVPSQLLMNHLQSQVTNAYRQVHLLYKYGGSGKCLPRRHKCLSASTFTVPVIKISETSVSQSHKCLSASTFTVPLLSIGQSRQLRGSQMPIGKYIYCTPKKILLGNSFPMVTNAYRQVHLLYQYYGTGYVYHWVTNAYRQVHLLYLFHKGKLCEIWSGHKCLSASTFTVPVETPRSVKAPR